MLYFSKRVLFYILLLLITLTSIFFFIPTNNSVALGTTQQQDSTNHKIAVKEKLVTFGFRKNTGSRIINTLVVHSMYNPEQADSFAFENCLLLLRRYNVSAHYIIDRQGIIYRIVAENDFSWHAGGGKMPDGRTDINAFSIGVELINSKFTQPTELQYQALTNLYIDLRRRYPINAVVAHGETDPARRSDPWNFDWVRFRAKIAEINNMYPLK